jgi:carboxyl-terminal processing protease
MKRFSEMARLLGVAVVLCCGADWCLTRCNAQDSAPVTSPATPSSKSDEYYELLKLFVDTLDQVERNYVQDLSRRELVEAAIQGMLSKLDQHTNYISPKELDHFRTGVESEFGGIGITVMVRNSELTVSSSVVGSPAYRAGLITGDVITSAGGKPLRGVPIDQAVQLLKGKPGTTVEFEVRRAKDGSIQTMKLTREVVRMETVTGHARKPDNSWDYWIDPDKKVAYVRVSSFARHTAEDLHKALTDLRANEVQGLILDLRFNPGGLLSSAIEISDMFISQGRIVSTSGRNVEERHWDARRRGTFEGFSMVVMVNRSSASASEIVAACLQDNKRAIVVGERSWGKGSVQNVVELEGGHSALKLTTAKYYRPSGKDINRDENEGDDGEWGVTPDDGYELRLTRSELFELSDVLVHQTRLWSEETANSSKFVDRQLKKAVEYLANQPKDGDAQPKSKPDSPADAVAEKK